MTLQPCKPCQVAAGSLSLSFYFRGHDGTIEGPVGVSLTGGSALVGLSYQWTSPVIKIDQFDPTLPAGSESACPYFKAIFQCSPIQPGLALTMNWSQSSDGSANTDCNFIQYSGLGTVVSCSPLTLTYGPTVISTTGAPRFYSGIVSQ